MSILRVLAIAAVLASPLPSAVGASIPGLFNTGVSDAGALLAGGTVDPHYRLIQSADASAPGPNAIVINEGWPIAPAASGPWLANGPSSKWISPMASQATGNLPGNYVYRLTFSLTGLDPETAVVTGRWSSDNEGVDILVNGASTGITYDGNFGAMSGAWTINQGFVEGANTLDFVINNAGTSVNPTGFRCELSGAADLPLPPGTPPTISVQPQSATVSLQDPALLTVKARGSLPLYYQWRHNGVPVDNATNSVYSLASARPADAGAYDVVVTNDAGSVIGGPAVLTVLFSPPAQPALEPLGPANRRSGVAISEIMYHPPDRADGRNLEFIELYNSNPWAEDLAGWRLSGDVHWTFPSGTTIPGLGMLVLATVPADVQAVYGISGVLGGFTNNLPNGGGTIHLRKRSGAIVFDVTYSDQPPWPVAADGAGHSLVLARPSFGERNPTAWAASAKVGGSPGSREGASNAPEDFVVVNELLAHTDPPETDYVELFNAGPFVADLSGCWLSDDPATNKFRIPDGSALEPRRFLAFREAELGFALSASGETVYLVNSNRTRVIDVVRFGGQAAGLPYGRCPDGSPTWSSLSSPSFGTTNAAPLLPEVVINELMFNPVSGDNDDEYIELYNRANHSVNLAGWRLHGGIGYAFPSNTVLAAGGYLVVARNTEHLRANYSNLTGVNCLGDFTGGLANGGERVTLEKPDAALGTNANGTVTTNRFHVVVSEVNYLGRSRWSRFADAGGSSLELTDARANTRLAQSWADSDESAKGSWTSVEFTGTVDNAMPGVNADQVQLFLLGEGEALVDNVEVVVTGVNRVPNSDFESGASGWYFQGTQSASRWESGAGYYSTHSLRLIASDRGEPIVNRARAPLTTTISVGSTVTLRAKVRWLAGKPEFLMRLRGGGLDATARLATPSNLGTPGAQNSRATANAGPAITDVSHRPVLPQAGETIRVVARVADPDSVASVVLRYRIDPSASLTTVSMRDDGQGDDLMAGDGVYTATLPGQAKDTMIAFRVEATDGAAAPATSVFPPGAPAHECLVRVGDAFISGPFENYRIWMTQATLNNWASRGNLSNDPLDVTFLYGKSRVIYSAGGMYGGSPAWSPSYNSPIGNICAYDILPPGDDLLLNEDKLGLDLPIRDATNQREQLMHWIADQYNLPNLYRRDVYLFVNGYRRSTIYHDTQQPGGDFLDEWVPNDPNGTLVKTTQWSEGTDSGVPDNILLNTLDRFTSGGVLKTARYRWNWRLRATDSQLDYSTFFSLVEAVNAPAAAYQSDVEGLINVEDWMRMFAMNDLCSFWDAFGNPNQKNTFLYKPTQDRWRLLPWDFDVGLGVFNDPVDAELFPTSVDSTVRRMYAFPAFVRYYWRELEFGVNNFFKGTVVTPQLTARFQAYSTNGLSFTSPLVASGAYGLSVPDWIDQRRSFLLGQLSTVSASFAVLSPTNFSTNRNLALLRGTAPISVESLTIDGVPYPVYWTNVTTWILQVPLLPGTNAFSLAGLDRNGLLITNTLRAITVNYTGLADKPEDWIAINEIMFDPLTPGGSFIELFNRSTNTTFDLSGWRFNGLDFTFPSGSLLAPRACLVLAKDREVFARVYGTGIPVFAEFSGQLDNGGETLTLFRPGSEPGGEIVVDRVRYESSAPWSTNASGTGSSLQLADAAQDNSRSANWYSYYVPAVWTPAVDIPASTNSGWRQVSVTGKMGAFNKLLMFMTNAPGGDLYIDDLALVAGTNAAVGYNYIRNGDFEAPLLDVPPLTNSFVVPTNYTNTAISSEFKHGGNSSLHLVCGQGSSALAKTVVQSLSPAPPVDTVCTLSYWYLVTTSAKDFTIRLQANGTLTTYTNVQPLVNPPIHIPAQLVSPATNYATPGAANSFVTNLPSFPAVWLNEVQPDNLAGLRDAAGHRVPWIEIFNPGPDPVSLEGLFLANNYTNLGQWPFPPGSALDPGQFAIVFADAAESETTLTEWHAGFTLAGASGCVALSRAADGRFQLLDFINYADVKPDYSYGSYPDGQPFYRLDFYHPTPGATNDPIRPPVRLFINEWMAANQTFLADPMDGRFEDWFEIWNPGTSPVDLTDFALTDDPADPNKTVVPAGIVVPAQGFLLVWADQDPGQTTTNGDLHVNFRLSQTGEAIELRDPQGRIIDSVAFGPQTVDVSEGRYPDGGANRFLMIVPTPRLPNVYQAGSSVQMLPLAMNGGLAVTVSWVAQAGSKYRVQFKEDLSTPAWTDLPGDVTATGPLAGKVDDTIGSSGQRFYRIVLVP